MPPYARLFKDMCTIKGVTSVPKKNFLSFGISFIISH